MSRSFASASSQYLNRNSFRVVTAASPRTINIWGRTTQTSQTLIDHSKPNFPGGAGWMRLSEDGSGNIVLDVWDGLNSGVATSSAGITSNVWFMATGIILSTTDHRVYLDGGNIGYDSTSVNTKNYTRLAIGSNNGGGSYWDGQLAEVAVWDDALTDHEVAVLYESRAQALTMRPDALLMYMSMMDDADYAEFGTLAGASAGTRLDFTANGGPTVSAEHPPIVRQAGGLF